MTFEPDVLVRLRALTSDVFCAWSHAQLVDARPADGRVAAWRGDRRRVVLEACERIPGLPLEQAELLAELPPCSTDAMAGLGPVGEALSFLARRYLGLVRGYPVPRHERLLEFHEIRLLMSSDQVACWKVAETLRSEGLRSLPPARLDWHLSMPVEMPTLGRVLDTGAVDCHVHLGGVLGSADLWWQVLDPAVRADRLAKLWPDEWHSDHGERGLLGPLARRRLDDARELRDLLWLHLARVGAVADSRADAVLESGVETLYQRIAAEPALTRRLDGPVDVPGSLVVVPRHTIVPALSSPTLRTLREAERFGSDAHVLGERALLVHGFLAAIGHYGPPPPWFGPVLMVYVVTQNLYHRAVTQCVRRVGLANFLRWYDAPARELHVDAQRLMRLILRRATRSWRQRVEGRVVPRRETMSAWLDAFRDCREWADPQLRADLEAGRRFELGRDFGLVVHFIKERDRRSSGGGRDDGVEGSTLALALRHGWLRGEVRRLAVDLEDFRAGDREAARGIVGIDAARHEKDAGPEIFAPAFRFLRRPFPQSLSNDPWLGRSLEAPPPLRATFHVGESFHHPVSGLRAVDEAMRFLDLRPGDRLGHAVALGIDAERWVERCSGATSLYRGQRLDDLVWLARRVRDMPGHPGVDTSALDDLINAEFEALYAPAFPDCGQRNRFHASFRSATDVLAAAWSIRWMDPTELLAVLEKRFQWAPHTHQPANTAEWDDGPDVDVTLTDGGMTWRRASVQLESITSGEVSDVSLLCWWVYQYDLGFRDRADVPVPWVCPNFELARAYGPLRDAITAEAAARALVLEACPTSNTRIGAFGDIGEHPIYTWDGPGPCDRAAPVRPPAVVCTDDPGVFATDLPNELALLARGAEGRGTSSRDTTQWIRRLIEQSATHSFLHGDEPDAYAEPGSSDEAGPVTTFDWSPSRSPDELSRSLRSRAEMQRVRDRLRRKLTP